MVAIFFFSFFSPLWSHHRWECIIIGGRWPLKLSRLVYSLCPCQTLPISSCGGAHTPLYKTLSSKPSRGWHSFRNCGVHVRGPSLFNSINFGPCSKHRGPCFSCLNYALRCLYWPVWIW
ncbi:hypothetical protein BS50DRAFT_92964 [Corynespora cassiicola Philippines]|uniref:Secreted protein n=1 Tax=Corynespora cassiicola Philippines TaxID=1448308 RepID=A0A2T2NEQ3_CORCC|nr:hypothetical protein BS50DRAFT_92964 [Corynespora cassiicola Philippines]